jgi:hypothetical protein
MSTRNTSAASKSYRCIPVLYTFPFRILNGVHPTGTHSARSSRHSTACGYYCLRHIFQTPHGTDVAPRHGKQILHRLIHLCFRSLDRMHLIGHTPREHRGTNNIQQPHSLLHIIKAPWDTAVASLPDAQQQPILPRLHYSKVRLSIYYHHQVDVTQQSQ